MEAGLAFMAHTEYNPCQESPERKSIHELTGANRVSDGAFDEVLSHAREDRDAAILSVYLRMAREAFNLHFHSEYTEAALKRLGFVWQ